MVICESYLVGHVVPNDTKMDDGKMEWYPVPSLERIASLKIVTHLLRSPSVLKTLLSVHNDLHVSVHAVSKLMNEFDWVHYRRRVGLARLLEQLVLPNHVRRQLIALCEPVALQLVCWALEFKKCVDARCHGTRPKMADVLMRVRWTFDGRVDTEGTAKALLRAAEEERELPFAAHEHFGLACRFYLERAPFLLWLEQEQQQQQLTSEIREMLGRYEREKESIVDSNFWRQALEKSVWLFDERGFKQSLRKLLASDDLDPENIADRIVRCMTHFGVDVLFLNGLPVNFVHPSYPEILRFTMSHLSEHLCKKKVFEHVGEKFLEWPYQDFILKVARVTNWGLRSNFEFGNLLSAMAVKITAEVGEHVGPFDYGQLFRDFWSLAPATCKNSLIAEFSMCGVRFMRQLLLENWQMPVSAKIDLVAFVLKDLDCEKKRSYFVKFGQFFCKIWIPRKERRMLCCAVSSFMGLETEQDDGPSAEERVMDQLVDLGWLSTSEAKEVLSDWDDYWEKTLRQKI